MGKNNKPNRKKIANKATVHSHKHEQQSGKSELERVNQTNDSNKKQILYSIMLKVFRPKFTDELQQNSAPLSYFFQRPSLDQTNLGRMVRKDIAVTQSSATGSGNERERLRRKLAQRQNKDNHLDKDLELVKPISGAERAMISLVTGDKDPNSQQFCHAAQEVIRMATPGTVLQLDMSNENINTVAAALSTLLQKITNNIDNDKASTNFKFLINQRAAIQATLNRHQHACHTWQVLVQETSTYTAEQLMPIKDDIAASLANTLFNAKDYEEQPSEQETLAILAKSISNITIKQISVDEFDDATASQKATM